MKRTLALLLTALTAATLAACGTTSTNTGLKGEAHEVAQAVTDFQTDATARDEKKVCANDLSSAVVTRLNAASGGCKQAIKTQLAEVDNFEADVQSVRLSTTPGKHTATALVKSTDGGKTRLTRVALVKEGGRWKVSGLG